MIIRCSNLNYRFYLSDGWTRSAVNEIFLFSNIQCILPVYYDYDKLENIISFRYKDLTHNCLCLPESMNENKFEDADYFAVYCFSSLHDNINQLQLSKHEIIDTL